MIADLFWRAYCSRTKSPGHTLSCRVEVPEGATWQEIIKAGEVRTGLSLSTKGSMGVFEIQTDAGIWSGREERPLRKTTATFKTWEELDNE